MKKYPSLYNKAQDIQKEQIKEFVKEHLNTQLTKKNEAKIGRKTMLTKEERMIVKEINTERQKRASEVSLRLFQLGKLYQDKKDVLRDREMIRRKGEEDKILQVAKIRHAKKKKAKKKKAKKMSIGIEKVDEVTNEDLDCQPLTQRVQPTEKVEVRLMKYQDRYNSKKKELEKSMLEEEKKIMREVPQINEKSRVMISSNRALDGSRVEDRLIKTGMEKLAYLTQV